ncbi:hypothetical protein EPN18_04505 [bacterium]|nr:MAG: hypothetical protein EPN18_04505 [bacterium]
MLTKRLGSWLLECLPTGILWAVMVLVGGIIALQIGIHHGRALERADIIEETAALNAAIKGLEAEAQRLKTERTVAGIIECESGGNHEGTWGDNGRSYGWLQFKRTTFDEFAGRMGFSKADWKNKYDQVAVALWGIDNGYGPAWSCYEKAGARG